jgi:hypothetical protein
MVDLGKKKRRNAVGSDGCLYAFAMHLEYHYIEWAFNFRKGVRTTKRLLWKLVRYFGQPNIHTDDIK